MSMPTSASETTLLPPQFGPPPALRPPPIQIGGPPKPPAATGANITVGFLLRSFQHWWRIAVPAGLVCAVLAGVAVWSSWSPKYRASALIRIPDRGGVLLPNSPDTSPRFAQTQLRSIGSEVVLRPALADPKIAKIPEIRRQTDPLEYLIKNLKVIGEGQSELYRIEYVSDSAEDAATIVNVVLATYFGGLDAYDSARLKELLGKLDEIKAIRSAEIKRLQDMILEAERGVIGKIPDKGNSMAAINVLSPLFALQQRMITVEADREVLRAQIAVYGEPAPAEPAEIPNDVLDAEVKWDPAVRELGRTLAAMHSQLDDIEKKSRQGKQSSSYKDFAVQIANAEKELATLKDEVRAQIKLKHSVAGQTVHGQEAVEWRQRLTALDAEHTLLKRRYDDYMKELSSNAEKSTRLQFMHADLERESGIFAKIADRKLQIETETKNPQKVFVASPATVPPAPIDAWPYKQLVLFCGAAFVLPFFVVVGWERFSRRIADADQLSSEATLTIVGEIAQLPTRPVISGGTASRRRIRRDLGLFQESVDALRTCLLLSENTGCHRVFAVTSAVSGEGKTSLVSQLAISLARATGKRTLIVDADLRSPNLHEIFDARLGPGLADVLRGQCEITDAIVEEVAEGVHLLPAGRVTSSPHNYLGNGAIPRLIGQLREVYDFIVIDTPPILSASESLVLAKAADGTLLCALRDISRSRQVRLASERLTMAGVNLMGAVLSGTSARRYASTYGSYAYIGESV
ncbi:MAG: polysaccharide biosynthesis tyrosine autokinase [Pirellulales bacterium]